MERLFEIYDEDTANRIIETSNYDEEKLCLVIPYICGSYEEPDEVTEAKIYVLAHDPYFFFRFGEEIDSVPDVRPFSEETRRSMKISWYPWLEIQREFSELYEREEYVQEFNILMTGNYSNVYINFHRKDEYKEDLEKFFISYPVISYILLLKIKKNHPLAVLLNYPYIFDLERTEDTYKLVAYAQNTEVVDFLLEGVDPSLLDDSELKNPVVYKWLMNYGVPDRINIDPWYYNLYRIQKDDPEFLKTKDITNPDEIKFLTSTFIEYGAERLLRKIMEQHENIVYFFILEILNKGFPEEYNIKLNRKSVKTALNVLRSVYGIRRRYDDLDALEKALRWGLLEWIKDSSKKLSIVELSSHISFNKKKIHPFLYFLEKHKRFHPRYLKEMIQYLEGLYNKNPTDLLREASDNHLRGAIVLLLEIYDYSKEELKETILSLL